MRVETPPELESFERAFSGNTNGCRRVCNCGVTFYDWYNDGWDWEEGEMEKLQADPDAVGLDYSVGSVCFEGKEFVADCGCWHERARTIVGFINGHANEIAHFLTLEKKRKQAEADNSPEVK